MTFKAHLNLKVILLIIISTLSTSIGIARVQNDSTKTNIIESNKSSEFINQREGFPEINIQNNLPENSTDYISAIIPLLTLVLGFILNKWYDSFMKKKHEIEEGTQWIENFIQLREPLQKQTNSLSEYIPLNDENHFEISDPSFQVRLECQVFSTLDEKSLVTFLSNDKNKLTCKDSIICAGKLIDVVKIIKSNADFYKDTIKQMKVEVSNNITLFNPIFSEFKMKVAEYWDYANAEYEENSSELIEAGKMSNLMKRHVLPHIDSGEFNLFDLADQFIKPFFDATFIDRENEKIKEINKLLHNCDMYLKAIKMEKKYFRIKLEKILTQFNEAKSSIDEILENPKLSER